MKKKKGTGNMGRSAKQASLLSFRPLGRPLALGDVEAEFRAMAAELKAAPSAEGMRRVGLGSGTHLLKLASPRAGAGQSVLRIWDDRRNTRAAPIPSVNAPDIPLAKVAYRPLEVTGHPARGLVAHLLEPDDISAQVVEAFARVFGADVLEALRSALLAPLPPITTLPSAEFPIIFLPNPAGGDLQATPLSPAASFPGMWDVAAPFFRPREEKGPRGRWSNQVVSAKPQNISGAIRKERLRFRADFPGMLRHFEAALHRFRLGGAFPRMPDAEAADKILSYCAALDRAATYENADIKRGLDARADALIRLASAFIAEVLTEAGQVDAAGQERPVPSCDAILLRCFRHGTDDHGRARQAVVGDHFQSRLRKLEDAP